MNAEASKNLYSLDSKNNSESSGSTSKHYDSMEENCRVTGRKRKSRSSPEPPRKRQRGSEVAVEAEMPRGTKRRASSPSESPKKKKRGCSNFTDASDATEVSVESVTARGTQRKSSAEQESPKKKRSTDTSTTSGESTEESAETESTTESSDEQRSETENSRWSWSMSSSDPSSSSCSPSTSKQDKGSTSRYNRSIKNFEAKYLQLNKLGEGGFGSVYVGYRKADELPVAIKHIPKEDVRKTRPMEFNGKTYMIPTEVILMIRAAGGPESIGESATITLLDWFDLEQEDLLVMERPFPSKDLYDYLVENKGPIKEDQAKNIMKQMVEAAIKMHSQGVFHRDIKLENVLVETESDVPRVRVIDFGCGCFLEEGPFSKFSGTTAYAPPEYFFQSKYEAGPTTVWQLGALLYELLKGDTRFNTISFLCDKITFFHDLTGLNMSEDCYNFFKMCLAQDPKERATLEQMQQHPWFR